MGYTPHVLVIGGGVVGTGIARDLSVRGLDVTLVEQGTLTAGATGKMQGILYSGARETDSGIVADQLHRENATIREIAPHCIEDTGGLLVALEGDDGGVLDDHLETCREQEIPAEVVDGTELDERAPSLADGVTRGVSVPDAVVDPFQLTVANARSAQEHGAEIRLQATVTDISVDDGTVDTVTVDHESPPEDEPEGGSSYPGGNSPVPDGGDSGDAATDPHEGVRGPAHTPGALDPEPTGPDELAAEFEKLQDDSIVDLEPDYVVNATGAWADEITGLLDVDVPLACSAGVMAVAEGTRVETVVTRCRESDSGNTLVPYGTNTLLGSTHDEVSGPDQQPESEGDVDRLLDELDDLLPGIADSHFLRAFWGVRCWPGPADSRHRFAVVDHGSRDGVWGMSTVVGGSLTTHRLAAEKVTDQVCEKFGISRTCQTDEITLPEAAHRDSPPEAMEAFGASWPLDERSIPGRAGDQSRSVRRGAGSPVVCECQSVTSSAVEAALTDESSADDDLDGVRIRTGAAMGTCQGGRCAHRLAAHVYDGYDTETPATERDELLAERWEGQRKTLWGANLEVAAKNYRLHADAMNRKADRIEFQEAVEDVDGDDQDGDGVTDGEPRDIVAIAAFDRVPAERASESKAPFGELPPRRWLTERPGEPSTGRGSSGGPLKVGLPVPLWPDGQSGGGGSRR